MTAPSDGNPETASAWAERAERLSRMGHEREALAAASQALKLDPMLARMWGCVGRLLLKRGRWAEAQDYLAQGVSLDPQNAVMRSHLAMALMEQDDLAAAQTEIGAALRADEDCADALLLNAEIMCRMGKYREAVPFYKRAHLSGGIGNTALFGQGAATFMTGNYKEGLALLARAAPAKDPMPAPEWNGRADPGLHVVLCGEYGFGDILHFARYAHELKKRVGKVTFNVPEQLIALLQDSFPDFRMMKRGDTLPAGDAGKIAKCFYMDLPHWLGGTFDAKADAVPYLAADAKRAAAWEERLSSTPRPRIGLVWAGNPLHQNDHNRSVPFGALAPLIKLAKPHLISLQHDGQKDAAGAGLFDATPFINDFADSAAALRQMDLLITIDSAPAHLAGGLGIPVWTLLPFNPDWRWLAGRTDSIWYPSMRLFRQQKPKDWPGVIEVVCEDVENLFETTS